MIQTTPFVKQKTIENCATVSLLDNGVIELQWDRNLSEVSKNDLISIRDVIGELGEGKKMPVLVSIIDFLSMTEDAKTFSSSAEAQQFTIANAIIIDNMAKKMLFNFFIKFNRPQNPTKSFSTREQAIDWLLAIKAASTKQFI